GSPTAMGIDLARDIVDRTARRIESRQGVGFGKLRLAGLCQRCSLDKERHLEHAIMSDEANGVAHFVEAAARIGKFERHRRHSSAVRGAVRMPAIGLPPFRRRASVRRLSDSMPSVAAPWLSPIIVLPSMRAGTPVKTW